MAESTVESDVIAALEQRLWRLEAERDIQQLMVKYSMSLDYGDNNAWAECFTPNGVFDVRRRGEPLFAHTGTVALAAFAATHTHAPAVYHKHFLSIPAIVLDGETAHATTYFTMLHEGLGETKTMPVVLVIGRYVDDFVYSAGEWRFSTRVVDMEALPGSAS
jgi:hypothetical protein